MEPSLTFQSFSAWDLSIFSAFFHPQVGLIYHSIHPVQIGCGRAEPPYKWRCIKMVFFFVIYRCISIYFRHDYYLISMNIIRY